MVSTVSSSTEVSAATQYQASELLTILNRFKSDQVTGVYRFSVIIPKVQRSRALFLVFKGGQLCWATAKILTPEEFLEFLGKKLNIPSLSMGIKFAATRVNDRSSIRELLSLMVNMSAFAWKDVEQACFRETICSLEQILPYSGTYQSEPDISCDIAFTVEEKGLSWKEIFQELNSRRIKWLRLNDNVSGLDAIPCVKHNLSPTQDVTNEFKQVQPALDGTRTLSELAEAFKLDHLAFAVHCHSWARSGWIYFKGEAGDSAEGLSSVSQHINSIDAGPHAASKRATILCVDDSPIVRTMLKRSLVDLYDVKLASSGPEALSILKDAAVSMVLLDVTMPDMDGYEVCKLIRKIDRLKNLPVVMITAKDSVFDRVKGKLSGTDRYLTKPISPNKVVATVAEFVGT